MRRILIVGGGYAGFYTAWRLERRLRPGEAAVTVADPRGYMTYQPFLPEVSAGSVEARHSVVSLRRHLHRTRVLAGHVTAVDHAVRAATVRTPDGRDQRLSYDVLVLTAGAVTRRLPVPGLVEEAFGLRTVEEAVAIRDHLLTGFARAAELPPGPERRRALTVTVVGGGFTGVELFGELLALASAVLRVYPELTPDDLTFHLVEASDRILPEVTDRPGRWVVRHLRDRGGRVHLGARVLSAEGGHVTLSTGEEFDTDLFVWAAGNGPNPVVANHTDLPVDGQGRLVVRADLRVGTDTHPVADAWAAGDDAAVPDLASRVPGARTVPNAQHAVRQGKRLATNILADLRGRPARSYVHASLGTVATLGYGHGIFQYRWIVVRGWPAWLLHRGYHVLAVPTWDRKVRVCLVWLATALFGRDIAPLPDIDRPRRALVAGGDPDLLVPPRERAAVAADGQSEAIRAHRPPGVVTSTGAARSFT